MSLGAALQDVALRHGYARDLVESARVLAAAAADKQVLLEQVDEVLRALLKQKTDESFAGVEQLLLRALQTVFDDDTWERVRIEVAPSRGRLSGEILLCYRGIEAPVLEAFGGGPASLLAFVLRILVIRRLGLAPFVVLDESFAQVSATYLANLLAFLRIVSGQLGVTIVWVTHQVGAAEHGDRAYRFYLDGDRTAVEVLK